MKKEKLYNPEKTGSFVMMFGFKQMKTELSNIKEVDKVIEEILEQEEIQYTCCGDEITGEVEDIGLCPTCLEHI
jgi:hypothetical protein